MTGRTRLQLEEWNLRQGRIVEEFPWLSALDRKINTVLCVMRNGLRVRNKVPFQQPCLAPCPTHRFSLLSGSFSDMGGNGGKNILFPRKKTSCSINISYWIIYSLSYTFFPLFIIIQHESIKVQNKTSQKINIISDGYQHFFCKKTF